MGESESGSNVPIHAMKGGRLACTPKDKKELMGPGCANAPFVSFRRRELVTCLLCKEKIGVPSQAELTAFMKSRVEIPKTKERKLQKKEKRKPKKKPVLSTLVRVAPQRMEFDIPVFVEKAVLEPVLVEVKAPIAPFHVAEKVPSLVPSPQKPERRSYFGIDVSKGRSSNDLF
jgi:hypothetical protein